MFIKLRLSLLFIAFTLNLNSQTCLSGGVAFSNQAQIDDFSTDYPGCSQILGNVTISGSDIESLNGLSSITQIDGDLTIRANNLLSNLTGLEGLTTVMSGVLIRDNNSLTSISSLQNLSSIGERLDIWNNDGLSNLNGLNSLMTIGNFLNIYDNDGLISLAALSNLTSIGGFLNIQENDILPNVAGLENLETLGASLTIVENDGITTITGLNSLVSTGGGLQIASNDQLSTVTGLNDLSSIDGRLLISNSLSLTSFSGLFSLLIIEGNLEVVNNPMLSSFSGLNNLNSIAGNLFISNNPSLNSISALSNLTSIAGFLSVVNNDGLTSLSGVDNIDYQTMNALYLNGSLNLSICDVQSICDFLNFGCCGYTIFGNSTGCNSATEILEACDVLPVELIYFTAQTAGTSVRLSWETASELNNDNFIVEYSRDGQNFEEIAKIPGSGTTFSNQRYAFDHLTPAKGFNYYRLKQVDFDGSFEYSAIESANIKAESKLFNFYPNPTSGVITFSENDIIGKSIGIYDYAGQLIQNVVVKNRSINISDLPSGLYFLLGVNEKFNMARRILKY